MVDDEKDVEVPKAPDAQAPPEDDGLPPTIPGAQISLIASGGPIDGGGVPLREAETGDDSE